MPRYDHKVLPGEGKQITNNHDIPSSRPYDHYCCALRDYDESVTGEATRCNFLAMLKLTAKMQHKSLAGELRVILGRPGKHSSLEMWWDRLEVGYGNYCILVCSLTLKRTCNEAAILKFNMAVI